jgi:oligoendopeptidase F
MNRRLSFLARELRRIDGKALARFVKQRASLNRCKFAIEEYRRQAPHELKPEEADLLATLDPFIQGWTGEFYNRVANQNADWASIENDLAFAHGADGIQIFYLVRNGRGRQARLD